MNARTRYIAGGLLLFFFLGAGALFLLNRHDVTSGDTPLTAATDSTAKTIDIANALFKAEGLPPELTIDGEAQSDGTLHPLSLLAQIPGQRAYGTKDIAPGKFNTGASALTLRLKNGETGKTAEISVTIERAKTPDSQNKLAISLSGFDSSTQTALALNGRVVYSRTPLDWNGRITLTQTADALDLIQLSIIPDEYQAYNITLGPLLPYYLQDFTVARKTVHGLAPVSFGDETTTADSNRQAQALLGTGGHVLGWWLRDDQSVLMARQVGNDCSASCETKIFEKSGDEWREIFSAGIDSLWLDPKTIGQPGSELYSSALNQDTNKWVWQDNHYILFDQAQEGE